MSLFDLEFESTIDERLGDMAEKADAFIKASGVTLIDSFGGSFVNPPPGMPEADNGYTIETDQDTAERIARELSTIVGHAVRVTEQES